MGVAFDFFKTDAKSTRPFWELASELLLLLLLPRLPWPLLLPPWYEDDDMTALLIMESLMQDEVTAAAQDLEPVMKSH